MDYKNPLKMIDPLTGMEMTPQPPMPANQMGTAKPVFNQTAQNVGNQVYGTPFQRQMSMPQPPMFMKDIPEGNKGKGLRALDDSVVEQMGYDSATKMMSPLDSHHPGDKKMLKTLTKKRKETTGLRKFANILTGGLGELAAEAVHNLKNYNNVSKQTFTKEKTNMPKKRVPRVNPGYVTDINTGERIGVEEIPFKNFKQR